MGRGHDRISCDPNRECKYREQDQCFEDIDHMYWPASEYRTELERKFRECILNKVVTCRMIHDERHLVEEPPEKPSREEMREVIEEDERLSRELGENWGHSTVSYKVGENGHLRERVRKRQRKETTVRRRSSRGYGGD